MLLQHNLLRDKAIELGYKVEELTRWKLIGLRIQHNDLERFIFEGTIYDSMSRCTELMIDNKQATKELLSGINIPSPKGIAFSRSQAKELVLDFIKGFPNKLWVCKPLDATEGMGIGLHMKNWGAIKTHLQKHPEYDQWLLEEFTEGNDVRVQVIGGKLAAACRREPASIIGNGSETIEKLIKEKLEEVQKNNPENSCDLDEETIGLLKNQGFTSSDTPSKGKKIWLKEISNMSKGARAIDITGELHPKYKDWVLQISKEFDVEIYSIDILSVDHKQNPATHAKVLELNARAVWLQHTFSDIKQHDIAGLIIRSLFQ
jgi:cyanophycin synthetase